jgi:FlaA1/EpsC-like NDP-sugar epimerase
VILSIDLAIVGFSLLLAYLLRFNFAIPASELYFFKYILPVVFGVRLVYSIVFKTYSGIVLYTSTEDAQRIFLSSLIGSLTFCLINFTTHYYKKVYLLPFSVVIIDFIVLVFFQTAFRLLIKTLYFEFANSKKHKLSAIIYGTQDLSVVLKNMMDRNENYNYDVTAIIDDNASKWNRKLEGVTIYDVAKLEELLKEQAVDQLFIAHVPSIENKKKVIELCLKYQVQVLHVPPMNKWINGELSINQIKNIKIEDLLERAPIQLNIEEISNELNGKKVLITGAAGSIGSEMARQILKFKPSKLFLLDQAETPIYELENELKDLVNCPPFETVLADVRNVERMDKVMKVFQPDIVFHAAAYKHVPLMENNPSESILTIVLGSMIVADLCLKYQVKKMVMVSTDKAVNPTGVMGASKRIAEIYVQGLDKISAQQNGTRYITTRFGNVLGSNGSVIPVFKKQIEEGGPVKVTHPEITRYFMTIPEACQLVLEAGVIGKGGEIMIFDMGESVKIADLAKKMIYLSGLELGKDIQLVFTGLRPGEKLYEELLNQQENTIPTHHEKIMIARVREYEFEPMKKNIYDLIDLFATQNNEAIVQKMKEIVPEYTSNNSVFEKLDNPVLPL